jgi:hypothetical protein|tara:strand:- start:2085 stop:2216 length:132 start_codon:yes stop_codon:yes gene_type:complete
MAQTTRRLNKVIKGLKKASKTHAAQAKTLSKIKKDRTTRKKKR